jgi:hypothetical protein
LSKRRNPSQPGNVTVDPTPETVTLPPVMGVDDVVNLVNRVKSGGWVDMPPENRAFAIAFAETSSYVKAAKAIGQSNSWGHKRMSDPLVLALIADLQMNLASINIITEAFVRQKWVEILPMLMGEIEVPLISSSGVPVEAKRFHASDTVAVLKELSKSVDNFYKTPTMDDFAVALRDALTK